MNLIIYPLVNIEKLWKITIFKFGKSTISIRAMFNRYVTNCQKVIQSRLKVEVVLCDKDSPQFSPEEVLEVDNVQRPLVVSL